MILRACLMFVLSALMVVTSVAAGVARGAADPVTGIEICRGHAAIVIYLDADGNEVEGWQLCPEAIGTLLVATAMPAPDAAPQEAASQTFWSRTAQAQLAGRTIEDLRSRGPPAQV